MQTQSDILSALEEVIALRKQSGHSDSYVARLHRGGLPEITGKITEEAQETVEAACERDVNQVIYETADLWFHSLVLLSYFDRSHSDVLEELSRRFGVSGIAEKASRGQH